MLSSAIVPLIMTMSKIHLSAMRINLHMVTRYSTPLQTDDVPPNHRIMSSQICTMCWVTSFNKHCTLIESVHVSLINPMFVPPPDATCSNIRCMISSGTPGRSQMLHGREQYASCQPPHSSLRTSTYCWLSSAAPRLSSDLWSSATPRPIYIYTAC